MDILNYDFEKMDECIKNQSRAPINALVKYKINIPGSINLSENNYQNDPNDTYKNKIKDLIGQWVNQNMSAVRQRQYSNQLHTPIVVYCGNTSCNKSNELIDVLSKFGFSDIANYGGGIKEWTLRGGAVEKRGKKILSGGELKKITNKTEWKYDENDDDDNTKKSKKSPSKPKSKQNKKEKDDDDKGSSKKSLPNKTVKKSVRSEYDLDVQFEKIVYEDIIYIHNVENDEVYDTSDNLMGVLKNNNIKWDTDDNHKKHILSRNKVSEEHNKEDVISSSSSEDDDSSDSSSEEEDSILDELKNVKKDVDNIKYRTHKVSLKCMSDITPKIYNNEFRGWGFTFWGN